MNSVPASQSYPSSTTYPFEFRAFGSHKGSWAMPYSSYYAYDQHTDPYNTWPVLMGAGVQSPQQNAEQANDRLNYLA